MVEDDDRRSFHQDKVQDPVEDVRRNGEKVAGDSMAIDQDTLMHVTTHTPLSARGLMNQDVRREEEAPESESARVERLGRERPTKFKSFGEELAFCYSIIASQFMAVSPQNPSTTASAIVNL